MKFRELALSGVFVVEPEPHVDHRGLFARVVCADEFSTHGLPEVYCQSSVSFNTRRGTLRGMHFQAAPSKEQKLVRCTRGALYDVVLDLRPSSPTFKGWVATELSASNRLSLAIPHGCAHGFMSLEDSTEVLYMMTEPHNPELATGVRWNDPVFDIRWPMEPVVITDRDSAYPDFKQGLSSGCRG